MNSFDRIAKGYDTDSRIERARDITDEIRKHIVDSKTKTAMEYGCGTGLVGLQLLQDFESVIFVDSSSGMIEQIRQKLKDMGLEEHTALCADFMDDVPSGLCVDYIFMSLVLHHIHDVKTILTRLRGVLREGGHLLVVDLDAEDGSFHANHNDFAGHNGFDRSELIALAIEAGFSAADAKTFYHGTKSAGGRDVPYSLFILDAAAMQPV